MQHISLLGPPTPAFVEFVKEKYSFDERERPQEDYLAISKHLPIFAVADGVTLLQCILDKDKMYPNPSPAGEVARLFCEKVVEESEARYDAVEDFDVAEIFGLANNAVKEYNREHGRTPNSIDYWNTDLYGATGAFAIVKGDVVHWASICDSYAAHIDRAGELIFHSPDCDTHAAHPAPKPENWEHMSRKERARFVWRVRRNGVGEDGEPVGYGVITGEEEAERYLNSGNFAVAEGDVVVLCTDGFEHYLEQEDFRRMLTEWPYNLEENISDYGREKAEEDPDRYGHERTLIAVKF